MAVINKIDSNLTGLRYAEEDSLNVLPAAASQIWLPLEPNSYSDFGGTITTVARNPINPNRSRKKGVVTDVTASGGINQDVTQTNLQNIMQGFFFADLRTKVEEAATQATTSSHKLHIANSTLKAGDLIMVSGFVNGGNNGLKRVTVVDTTDVTVAEVLIDETHAAKVVQVGHQFTASDAAISTSGTLPALTTDAMGKDLTQLGLIPGEFVFIGDEANALFSFAGTPANNGFARVRAVTAHSITFDKSSGTMAADTATSQTIRVFFGRVLKNETGTDIVRRSYCLERIMGYNNDSDITKEQAEYLHGSVADQFTFNCPTASKLNVDLTFKSLNHTVLDENVSGADTLLSKAAVAAGSAANAPAITESDAFNTSSDVSRIKLSTFTEGTSNPAALFAFVSELKLTINNNLDQNKAVGVVGAFEVTAGTFAVGGSLTAYFADVASVQAVEDNADITLDAHFVKANSGISFDIPLITLGNGRPQVEQDKAIMLPLDNLGSEGTKIDPHYTHTLLMVFWDYLPDSAE